MIAHISHSQDQRTTCVSPDPEDFEFYIAPHLTRPQRIEILRAIMAQHGAMVRVLLNPDWDSVQTDPGRPHYGCPTRYTLERVECLPRGLHATLVATGRISHDTWAERKEWRVALGCTKHASR